MLTFNTKSLHYKLAVFGGLYKYTKETDICSYTRKVMLGMFFAALSGLAIAFVGHIVANMVLAMAFSIIYGTLIYSETAIAGFIVVAVCLFWMGLVKAIDYVSEQREKTWDMPDSFVTHAYKSWKEKYCVKVGFREHKTEQEYEY